jgi:hypothetical protein
VVFLNLLERMEKILFGGLNKGYVTD